MPEYASNENIVVLNMDLPKVTPMVDSKVDMPASSAEVIPMLGDKDSPITTSPANTHSYRHALPVAEVIEMTQLLNLDVPIGQSTIDTAKDVKELKKYDKHATTPVDNDVATSAQDNKVLAPDSERIESQRNEVACTPRRGSEMEDSPIAHTSALSANSSTTIAPKSDNGALASTQPVPQIYPPRRPNIFSKRAPQRNVQWSAEVLATIPTSTHATEDIDNDEDGFTMEELQQFQAEGKQKMERKTEGFLRTVSQYSWRPRVVEDLGELFELEN